MYAGVAVRGLARRQAPASPFVTTSSLRSPRTSPTDRPEHTVHAGGGALRRRIRCFWRKNHGNGRSFGIAASPLMASLTPSFPAPAKFDMSEEFYRMKRLPPYVIAE